MSHALESQSIALERAGASISRFVWHGDLCFANSHTQRRNKRFKSTRRAPSTVLCNNAPAYGCCGPMNLFCGFSDWGQRHISRGLRLMFRGLQLGEEKRENLVANRLAVAFVTDIQESKRAGKRGGRMRCSALHHTHSCDCSTALEIVVYL